MVERTAPQTDFGSGKAAGAAPSQVGYVAPDVAAHRTGDTNKGGATDSMITSILGGLGKLAEVKSNQAYEEAYLNGRAAAGIGASLESVESNIFTRGWAKAGWSDTRARLALADAEATTASEMGKLRELSPDEFAKHLERRRQQVNTKTEGMSLEARKAFVTAQMTADRAAIAKHSTEHQKFIIDQIGKSVQTSTSVRFDEMTGSRGDEVAYLAAANNAYAGLHADIWNNPNLPEDMRQKLTVEAATAALQANHQVLYENMRDIRMPGGNTMLQKLPFDEQVKLSKAYEQSRKDTAAMRLGDYQQQWGFLEAELDNPVKPNPTYNEMMAFVQQGVQIGAMSAEQQKSLWNKWADASSKKAATSGLAQAYAQGDINTIFGMGKVEDDGYKAYIATATRSGKTPEQVASDLLQIGLATGQPSAFKGVGELTRSAISAIGMGDTMDAGQLDTLNSVLTALDKAQAAGNSGAMSAYLSSFGDAERGKIMLYREGLQQGKEATVAASEAADSYLKQSQLTESERNVLAANHAKANQAIVQEIGANSLWSQIAPDFLRFQDNVNRDKIGAKQGWFEDETRVNAAVMQSKVALQEELNYISRSDPYLSDDGRRKMALAKVAERTLTLKDGPLVLPRLPAGTTVQEYFGVDRSVSPELIASTLSELHTAGKGNRVVMKATGRSQLMWQEYGPDGELVKAGGTFDPKSVAGAVRAKQDKRTAEYMRTDGAGVTRKGSDGSEVTFNGNNTVGVPSWLMLDLRDQLVKSEAVRHTPYQDASGKLVGGKPVMTAGVGVSSHNPNYPKDVKDGKLTQQQINDSFMGASNDAAKLGVKYQRATGFHDPAGFKLLSELAYQGGSIPKETLTTFRDGSKAEAMAALKASPQYKHAHAARKDAYVRMLESLTKDRK